MEEGKRQTGEREKRSVSMNTRTTIAIGGLLAAVVAFAVALGVVFATDDANGAGGIRHGMAASDGSMGMMDAMGDMDSGPFVEYMRDVLGEDGFGRMLDHMREHRDGGPMTGDPTIDDMMHRMMDGMMEHMPADNGVMPGDLDTHHQTPAPRRTPGQ